MSAEDLEDNKPQFSQEDFEKLEMENKDLKTKVSEFRDNNLKFIQEKEEAQRLADEQAESNRLATEESARSNGKIQELEESLTNNFNEKLSVKDEMINKLVSGQVKSAKTAIVEEFKAKFMPEHKMAGEMLINSMVDVSVNDSGEIGVQFKSSSGEVFSTDKNTWFNDHVSKQFPEMIHGLDLKGGGATEGKSGGAVSTKNKAAEDAKSKGDVAGFLKAKFNQSKGK